MKPHADTAGSPTTASQCNNIGGDGADQVRRGDQLLDLDVIVSIGVASLQACCNACANTIVCIAFTFQPLLVTNACVLARLGDGTAAGQQDSNSLLNLDAVVNL